MPAPTLEEPSVLQSFKNVSLSPVDCGGRVLAVGEIAELHPHAHGVRDAVATGDLLALTTFAEAPTQSTAGDDEATDAPTDSASQKPPKTARKGSAKTATEES